jgi:adenylate cyclase
MADHSSLQRWIDMGLFDPSAQEAESFRDVITFYDSMGIDPADFEGVEPAHLMAAINMRILRPGRRFTAAEARSAAGLDDARFERLCRSAGYALDGEFTEMDVEAIAGFATASPLFSDDAINDFARTLSSAMARVADATTSAFRIDIGSQIEAAGGAEVDYARKNQESAALIEGLFLGMRALFLNQLTDAVRLGDEGWRASTSGAVTTIKVAVGFVDIVGYTQFSGSLEPDDLANFIRDFEATAIGLVTEHGGRLVKLIGDAIMFVAVDPVQAVAIAEAILEAFDGTAAQPRGGLAYGEVIALGGDYYGTVVNLASRIVDQAVPGEILVDSATIDRAGMQDFEAAGRRQLKGFDEPVALFAYRR